MAKFKPEVEPAITEAVQNIKNFISGNTSIKERKYFGITRADDAIKYLEKVLRADVKAVAIDTETTALYPKDGYVLGISLSYKETEAIYIDSNIF